jgi:hypothetical protein
MVLDAAIAGHLTDEDDPVLWDTATNTILTMPAWNVSSSLSLLVGGWVRMKGER